ncbi:DnaJ domain [Macleaya cordata]|uniref:DnaJ domain n=1 Tax=Macleaya cordata TaxID=56857 RepID=A0A200Q344_MACCD|nr:DnaJ domain [Macleaya cordata]
MSRGQSQPRTQFGRRTLDSCNGKSQSEDVVVIDVDNDDSHTASIADVSESSKQRLDDSDVVRKDNKLQPMSITIISIDDDEEDFSSGNDNEAGAEESDGYECDFIWRNMSKWKPTYYGGSLFGNHFGFNPDCESSSSEGDDSDHQSSSSQSDDSDCEIMVGSDGKIREQWEKAALRKKMYEDAPNGQTGLQDQVNASGFNSDTQKDVENTAEHHGGAPTCSSSSDSDEGKEGRSTSKATGADIIEDPFLDLDENNPIGDSAQTADRSSPSCCKSQSSNKSQFSHKEGGGWSRGKTPPKRPSYCGTELESESGINCNGASFRDRKQVPGRPFGSTGDGHIQFNYGRHSFKEKEENIPAESCSFHTQRGKKTCFNHKNTSFSHKGHYFFNSHQLDETEITRDSALSWDEVEGIFREPSLQHTQLPNDTEYRREIFEEEHPFFEEPSLFNTQPYDEMEIFNVKICSERKEESINREQSMCYVQGDEEKIKHGRIYFRDEEEPMLENLCSSQPKDERNSLMHDQECASSQPQLRIQSEEAMRLRKRKEAETLRLLDVERRQKQRVEEMREMKKKDEESINLKEHIRIEVRNELDKLEMQYSDMASLLRGLGLHVGGGLCPMPNEVHAAYKKALLRFHPDRASRTDLRQQVEAEEKFKLISRSKEKLLPAS